MVCVVISGMPYTVNSVYPVCGKSGMGCVFVEEKRRLKNEKSGMFVTFCFVLVPQFEIWKFGQKLFDFLKTLTKRTKTFTICCLISAPIVPQPFTLITKLSQLAERFNDTSARVQYE